VPTPVPESAIRETLEAYRVATYAIRLPGARRVVLRVGARTPPELDAFLDSIAPDRKAPDMNDPGAADLIRARASLTAASGLDSSAGLITAWNPFSRVVPLAENRARQRELLARLRGRARCVFAASGIGVDWREPGFAVFGMETEALDALAREFRQNAIVTFRARGKVRLRFYRDDWRDALADSDVDLAPPARS
jgi:hypothetical protein